MAETGRPTTCAPRKERQAERNAVIRQRYADGERVGELAQAFGLGQSSVSRIVANPDSPAWQRRRARDLAKKKAVYPEKRAQRAAYKRQWNYGVTPEQFEAMLAQQAGVCAICGNPETVGRKGRTRTLCVDHDHKTGEVRGLLCATCNHLLGYAQDDPAVLMSAIAYLLMRGEDNR